MDDAQQLVTQQPSREAFPEEDTVSALLANLRTQGPFWFIKSVTISVGHPIILLLYLFIFLNRIIGGIPAFTTISATVSRITIWLSVIITVPLCLVWLFLKIRVLSRLCSTFSVEYFLDAAAV
jgi:hypothetical protein